MFREPFANFGRAGVQALVAGREFVGLMKSSFQLLAISFRLSIRLRESGDGEVPAIFHRGFAANWNSRKWVGRFRGAEASRFLLVAIVASHPSPEKSEGWNTHSLWWAKVTKGRSRSPFDMDRHLRSTIRAQGRLSAAIT